MKLLVSICMLMMLSAGLYAQGNKEDNLKPYYMVLLKVGPNRDQDSATVARIQKEHLENINRMAQSGKLNIAGPFLDDGELRGVFVFDSNSEEEVRRMVEADPAVRSGRLTYEIHPWMTQKGTCFR